MQATLRSPIDFRGHGLHSGRPARLRLLPASANYGIWFKRTDIRDRDALIPARWDAVADTRLCTVLANADGVTVSTVEHLMAALAGSGVGNALIEIDGPEIPIMDGSARPFAEAIRAAGLRALDGESRAIRILAPVEVKDAGRLARLEPAERFELDFGIDFDAPAIGAQSKRLALVNGAVLDQLADSRTFCLRAEVEAMRASGLALGGSLDNAVVVDGERVLNPGGLRHPDEFVRHKMLDAVGDLALAGAPILGRYVGRRAGHEMNNRILRALFARPDAWRLEVVPSARAEGLGLRAAA
ncbi:MAG: UDP-3-O-acyl-N-acetylglucosamine deacetylase [Pseudomonadota bacterium]